MVPDTSVRGFSSTPAGAIHGEQQSHLLSLNAAARESGLQKQQQQPSSRPRRQEQKAETRNLIWQSNRLITRKGIRESKTFAPDKTPWPAGDAVQKVAYLKLQHHGPGSPPWQLGFAGA